MEARDPTEILRFGPFEVHPKWREVRKHGTKIRLTGKAYLLLMRLLEQPGEPVSREDLRVALWPDNTFVDFDHSLNAVVNRLRSHLQDSAEDHHYIETVPGVGYRFAGSVQNALMPRTAHQQSHSDGPNSELLRYRRLGVSPWRRATVLWSAGGLLACVIAVAVTISVGQATRPRSLALLPLQNLAGSSEQELLAEGFTDAITTELGRSPDLYVISETSTSLYKHTSKPLRVIAQELRAEYVVEGAVVSRGHQARVNVRLVHAAPDRYLWSKSYDVDLSEAARVQADIAREISSEINAKITPRQNAVRAQAAMPSASAYEDYLLGKHMLAGGTEESIRRAIQHFRKAIKQAPNYADAYAALGESYVALSTTYAAPNDVMPQARQAADAALRLDSTLSEAHAVRGRIAALYEWNWRDAERYLKRAIELNGSSASAHVSYVDFLVARGRYEEAAEEVSKAHMLDPVSLANSVALQLDAFDSERFDLLAISARKALELNADFSWPHTLLGWVEAQKGRISEGLAQAERGARNATSFEQIALLGEVQRMAGQQEAAQSSLNRLLAERQKNYVCGHAIASLCASLGRKEEALRWLETAYRERSDCMPYLKKDPTTASLRAEPQFQRLVRRVQEN